MSTTTLTPMEVSDRTRSNRGRLLRDLPRRPDADLGGRPPLIYPCPAGCKAMLAVSETWPHLRHCRKNQNPRTRITQAKWQEINRARIDARLATPEQEQRQQERDERKLVRFLQQRAQSVAS